LFIDVLAPGVSFLILYGTMEVCFHIKILGFHGAIKFAVFFDMARYSSTDMYLSTKLHGITSQRPSMLKIYYILICHYVGEMSLPENSKYELVFTSSFKVFPKMTYYTEVTLHLCIQYCLQSSSLGQ
jgi:hypothetical protein